MHVCIYCYDIDKLQEDDDCTELWDNVSSKNFIRDNCSPAYSFEYPISQSYVSSAMH